MGHRVGFRWISLLTSVVFLSAMPPVASEASGLTNIFTTITSVSAVSPLATQTILISGSGFGTQAPFNGDLPCIEVADLTAGWSAGHADPASAPGSDTGASCGTAQSSGVDLVTIAVSSWTDTAITITGFTGLYGSPYVLTAGDQIMFRIWNAQTGAGPASYTTTVGAQAIAFTSTAPSGAVVGGPSYLVTATGGASGNPVTFSIDASSTSGCSLSGSTVSFGGPAGTCVIDANQAGSTSYAAAPQVQQSFSVGMVVTFPVPQDPVFGGPVREGTASNPAAGTFTDPVADPASNYTATIDWGDGTVTVGSVGGGGGSYSVSATHTYVDERAVTAVMTVTDIDGSTGYAAETFSPAEGDNGVVAGSTLTLGVNTPFNGAVASFSDIYTAQTASDFIATIDWGDGTTTPAVLSGGSGEFIINGSHTYTAVGTYSITTLLSEDEGSIANVPISSTAIVEALTPQVIAFTSTAPSGAVVGGASYLVAATGGASGNPVTFSIDASSTSGCTVSGSTVSFGGAAGTCVVDANQAGNTSYAAAPQVQQSFLVTDHDLALQGVPGNSTVNATGPSGVVVSYPPPTALDEETPSAVICNHLSGSTFPIGTTTVNCTATGTDDTPSTVTASFTVTVKGALTQLTDLLTFVQPFPPGTSLVTKTQNAINYYKAGDLADTCSTLSSIISEANAQSGKKLTSTQAAAVVSAATRMRAVIGC